MQCSVPVRRGYHSYGRLAQQVEQPAFNRCVSGSNPLAPTGTCLEFYTDGSCKNNPGRGRYAWVETGTGMCFVSRTYSETTNNRMELSAVVSAVKHALRSGHTGNVTVWSDSDYTVKGVNEWSEAWFRSGKQGKKQN